MTLHEYLKKMEHAANFAEPSSEFKKLIEALQTAIEQRDFELGVQGDENTCGAYNADLLKILNGESK